MARLKQVRQQLADEVAQQKRVAEAKAKREANANEPKRFEFELKNYAWDQSDKFVKLFITLDGVQNATDDNVNVVFADRSIALQITGADDKDYKFEVQNLLDTIDVDKSYRKVKSNAVVIYAKKSTESEYKFVFVSIYFVCGFSYELCLHTMIAEKTWSHLTSTEKRLADVKDSSFGDMDDADKSDPTAGLMNIMRKMYETGDPETKKMIAKAWTEGQEKQMSGGGPLGGI